METPFPPPNELPFKEGVNPVYIHFFFLSPPCPPSLGPTRLFLPLLIFSPTYVFLFAVCVVYSSNAITTRQHPSFHPSCSSLQLGPVPETVAPPQFVGFDHNLFCGNFSQSPLFFFSFPLFFFLVGLRIRFRPKHFFVSLGEVELILLSSSFLQCRAVDKVVLIPVCPPSQFPVPSSLFY